MAVINEGNRLHDVLAWEQEKHYSRDKITIAADQVLAVGEVVGKITASGLYAAFNPGATDGTENAAGIVIDNYDATGADLDGVAIIRDAIFREGGVVWPDGITTPQKDAAIAQLEAIGIIIRQET